MCHKKQYARSSVHTQSAPAVGTSHIAVVATTKALFAAQASLVEVSNIQRYLDFFAGETVGDALAVEVSTSVMAALSCD